MVCRSPLKAKRDYIEKLAARENVTFVWDSEVSAILGDDGVSGVRVRNVKGGASSDIECAGLFPFIGGTPNTEFAPEVLLTATPKVTFETPLGVYRISGSRVRFPVMVMLFVSFAM